MSVLLTVSVMRKALWPKVEYNSSPGVAVSRLILIWQESWAKEKGRMEKKKPKNNRLILAARVLFLEMLSINCVNNFVAVEFFLNKKICVKIFN